MTITYRMLAFALLLCLFRLPAFSQEAASPASPATPNTEASAQNPTEPRKTAEEILKEEEKQRVLGVVPTFGVTNYQYAPPLTSKQKFELMAKTTIDPATFVIIGLQAGISQAQNNFPDYGQGAAGYAKRYGAAWTDSFDSNFFSNFFYPVLFKQDPRYFRIGQGTIKSRMGKAIEQEFVARKDHGGHTFHFSNILGAFTAGGISNAYYPAEDRGAWLTVSRATIALGYGCLGNVFLEFWPDISHKFFHKKENQAHPNEPPGTTPR